MGASGTATFVPQTRSLSWFDAGITAELLWQPISPLDLFVSAGTATPFKRYSYGFDPYIFYHVPAAIVGGTLGIGLSFD
jgi:hypothetical protein